MNNEPTNFEAKIDISFYIDKDGNIKEGHNTIGFKNKLILQDNFEEKIYSKIPEMTNDIKKFCNEFRKKYIEQFGKYIEPSSCERKINYKITSKDSINNGIKEALELYHKINNININSIIEIEFDNNIVQIDNNDTIESIKTKLGI